jgi:hypothetical protein
MLQAGRSRVRIPMISWMFLIFLILPAALWLYDPGNDWTSNRYEYQESSRLLKRGRHIELTTSPPSVRQFTQHLTEINTISKNRTVSGV